MAKKGYLERLLAGASKSGSSGPRRRSSGTGRRPRHKAERLNPPPQDGWKIITVAVALLTFGMLSMAGLIYSWADWTLIPLGFFCGTLYFAVQMVLSWQKDRKEDYGDLLKPRLQRGRPKPNQPVPEPFKEYPMREYLRELGGNALQVIRHHSVVATVLGISAGVGAWMFYHSYWIAIPTGILAVIVLLTIAEILSALRAMSKEERQTLYKNWGDQFVDTMAMTALAHPGGCSAEMAEFVTKRYRNRIRKENAE
jgi:hypothetical protein